MKIGLIGCGNISETYFNCQKIFNNFEITTCSDISQEAADKSAKEYNVKVQTNDELMASQEIDLILNLTPPSSHKDIIVKSLLSGKHCFSEKPLAMNFEEALAIEKLSKEKDLKVGCAPDTFLGAAGQKSRELLEKNTIGKILLGTFNLMSHGMEDWHPNPDFFFKPGAGPVLDVGVYYITQLVNLLGPIKLINAVSSIAQEERTITSQPRYGEKIKVETPTTLIGSLEFYNLAKIQFFCSWDVWKHKHTTIELYGLEGSMIVPDPNFFSGNILISKKNEEWKTINNDKMLLGTPNKEIDGLVLANYRGIGLADMINSIEKNRLARCSLDLSLHVLEVMEGILFAAESKKSYSTKTLCKKPQILTEHEIEKLKVI